jgi:hypothetical protein
MNSLLWIEDLLPDGILRKPMFGGLAYYIDGRLVLALFEKTNDRSYRGKNYDFELWFGCLFPVERSDHAELLRRFPFLRPHPILGKWLYLPFESEDFEGLVRKILVEIRRNSPLFGVVPPLKKKSGTRAGKSFTVGAIDTKTPRMFSDQPVKMRLATARRISDLKNLGPSSEKEFARAGINSVAEFFKLGWKKTMKKLVEAHPKNRHSLFAYALIGALTNQIWHKISDEEKQGAQRFVKSLKS